MSWWRRPPLPTIGEALLLGHIEHRLLEAKPGSVVGLTDEEITVWRKFNKGDFPMQDKRTMPEFLRTQQPQHPRVLDEFEPTPRSPTLEALATELSLDPIKQIAASIIVLKYQDMMLIARELSEKLGEGKCGPHELADLLHGWARDKFPSEPSND